MCFKSGKLQINTLKGAMLITINFVINDVKELRSK